MAQSEALGVKCISCNRIKGENSGIGDCDIEIQGSGTFWMCQRCNSDDKNRSKALEKLLLGDAKSKLHTSMVSKVAASTEKKECDSVNGSSCNCEACLERGHLDQEQLREVQFLQKCWMQLRQAVRQMYRDRLLRDGVSGKGKKFDVVKLSTLATKLCSRDPHQLYQRLESQSREHVMELKVQLLQILVSPEKAGVPGAAMENSNSESVSSRISSEVAEHFLRSLLNNTSQFIETVDNMRDFLGVLDKEHLEKFGISWRIVNINLLDLIVYRDPLLQATLPAIYVQLGFKLTTGDILNDGTVGVTVDRKQTPSHVADIMKNFIDFSAQLAAYRSRMESAHKRMEKYLSQQMKVYKATLKAKQKILKEDLEFFTQQRRLLEDYVAKKKELKMSNSSEEDVSAFAETLRCLLSANNRLGNELHCASTIECNRCHHSHCPCDQCSISHLIACGLIDEANSEVPESIQLADDFRADMQMQSGGAMRKWNLESSSDSSTSDTDVSECGSTENGEERLGVVDIICRKQTSIICGDGQKVTKVETTILPSSLYSLRSGDHSPTSVQRHMYNAYGDWEANVDASSLLFSNRLDLLLPSKNSDQTTGQKCGKHTSRLTKKCSNDDHHSTSEDRTDVDNDSTGDKVKNIANCNRPIGKNCVSKEKMARARSNPNTHTKAHSHCPLNGSNGITPSTVPKNIVTYTSLDPNDIKKPAPKISNANSAATAPKTKVVVVKADVDETKTCSQQQQHQQHLRQEWFKDPRNMKYAQALFASANAGNKDCMKYMNSDMESIKRLFAQHHEALKSADQSATNGDSCQHHKTPTPTSKHQHNNDAASIEEEDSWSDQSSVISQKDGKHCDCCYCEMFGHSGLDLQKNCGRDEYPQIRERLRNKLKKKENKNQQHTSEDVDGYRGSDSLDRLLEYIEGAPDSTGSSPAKNVKSTKKSSRQKPKRAETKKQEKKDQCSPVRQASNTKRDSKVLESCEKEAPDNTYNDGTDDLQQSNQAKVNKHSEVTSVEPMQNGDGLKDENRPPATTEKHHRRKRNSELEEVNIDEVFQPKDIDLNSTDLDEAEREVEYFKRLVMDCKPREKREKVQLNIGNLLRVNKAGGDSSM